MLKAAKQKNFELVDLVFILFLAISILCATSATLEEAEKTLPIVVPYMYIEKIDVVKYLLIAIAFGWTFIKRKSLILDKISIALMLRILIGIFQIFWIVVFLNGEVRLGNYFLWLMELVIYVTAYNSYTITRAENFFKCSYIFSLIISVEVILQAVLGILPSVAYSDIYYKACLHIPIGSSNYLSTFILPCLVASIISCNHKDFTWIICSLIQVSGIILTKSRAGMLLLMGILFLLFIKNFRHLKKWMVVALFAFLPLLFYFLGTHLSEIVKVFQGYSSVVSTGGRLNKVLSGRMDSIGDVLNSIMKYPIFGYGPNYVFSRPHNIAIDLLYQSGMVGMIVFFYYIYILLKGQEKIKCKKATIQYAMAVIVVIIVNAFTEVSILNSLLSDLMFFPTVAILANSKKASCANKE